MFRLLPHYPEPGHNGMTLREIADDWRDLMADEDVSEAEFVQAVRRHKKRSDFFPKLADILAGVRECREHPPARVDEAHRLPVESVVPLSRAEVAENIRRLKLLALLAAKRITNEECSRRMRSAAS